MSTRIPSPFGPNSRPRNGLVLIVVLALIALLSILIVSFIAFNKLNKSATFSYSKQIQAQEIAHGGIEDIVNDLRTEIIAGSSTQTGGGTYAPVYVPNTNWSAQPARLGFAAAAYGNDVSATNAAGQYLLPPTFVRESKASQDGIGTDLFSSTLNSSHGYNGTLPLNRASAASTTNSAYNSRLVSVARWAETDLLSTNASSAFLPAPFVTNAPDWVYVTRAGSRACTNGDLPNMLSAPLSGAPSSTANASPVVGRYAYIVYDEGALLDVNAAGYISNATNNFASLTNYPGTNAPANSYKDTATGIAQVTIGKTYSAYADLTQLPGLSGNQPIIDNLVKWRNASVNLATAASAGTNFYQASYTYGKSGFIAFQNSVNGTDSPIVNRQDLINYFTKIDPNINTASATYSKALPYLGSFTRAANAPSWNPPMNAAVLPSAGPNGLSGGGYSFVTTDTTAGGSTFTVFQSTRYKDNAELSTDADGATDQNGNVVKVANRDVPNVRWAVAGNVIHYNDDGTYYTYQVNKGDPLAQHRFSLAKIAWMNFINHATGLNSTAFNSSVTSSQQQSAIQDCFGLQWQQQNFTTTPYNFDRWNYVAATSSDVHILSLGEVAAGVSSTVSGYYREPNFFELLKAGVLSGSIGQSPGPEGGTNGEEGTPSGGLDQYYTDKSRHILQIGANIIDQFDTDSIPTAIYLQLFTPTTTEMDMAYNTVYGDENLPGLTVITQQACEDWYGMVNTTTGSITGAWKQWILPQVWNIHQAPPTGIDTGTSTSKGSPGYPRATELRIQAFGKVICENNIHPNGNTPEYTRPMDYDDLTTPYPYYDASTAPYSGELTGSTVAPTGTVNNIFGGQNPGVTSGLSTGTLSNAASPAGMLYFLDYGGAQSPFYRYPNFLQWQNLYASVFGSILPDFNPTTPLNISTTPFDMKMPWDNGAPIQFVALFAGEDDNYPNLSTWPTPSGPQFDTGVQNPLYLFMECQDPTTLYWHPYNVMSNLTLSAGNYIIGDNTASSNINYNGTPGTTAGYAQNGLTNRSGRGDSLGRPDPRTDRFSVAYFRISEDMTSSITDSFNSDFGSAPTAHAEDKWPWRIWGFVYPKVPPAAAPPYEGSSIYFSDWALNTTSAWAYYVDLDGVIRPGDSYRHNTSSGDGCLLYQGCGTGSPGGVNTTALGTSPSSLLPTSVKSAGSSVPTGSAQARRPMILNRPFRNVGELGYAFRDLPFKTLDFFSQYSADGALLDLFSVTDEPSITAGQVNLSNAPALTLKAIMSGATKQEIDPPYAGAYDPAYASGVNVTTGTPNYISPTEAGTLASSLGTSFGLNGPLRNRADLTVALDPILTTIAGTNPDYGNKAVAEAPIRALSNVASTRTWNLMIDIVAQSGMMSPTAQTLNDFVVQGERRYWLHIAIDRYTGKVLDEQLEPVYE